MEEKDLLTSEVWQVEIDSRIRDTDLEGLRALILEGGLLKHHKVRRGELRWLEAGKVPALADFFSQYAAAAPDLHIRETGTPETASFFIPETESAKPKTVQRRVRSFSPLGSFAAVLLISLVFTYLWMYFREASDMVEVKSSASNSAMAKETDPIYEKEKQLLSKQAAFNEQAIKNLSSSVKEAPPEPRFNGCIETHYSQEDLNAFSSSPRVESTTVDENCIERRRRELAEAKRTSDAATEKTKRELIAKREYFAVELEKLEENKKVHEAEAVISTVQTKGQGRFYYTFLPIFFFLGSFNGLRLFMKKRLAESLS